MNRTTIHLATYPATHILPLEVQLRDEIISELRNKISSLYDAIAHGDEAHRSWLKQKIKDHFGI